MRCCLFLRRAAVATAALVLVLSNAPARADTLDSILDILVTAGVVDSAVRDAKPLIECLIKASGDPTACIDVKAVAQQQAKDVAQQQAKAAAKAFVPEDPAIQAVVAIVRAVVARDWLEVLELAGTDLLFPLACKSGLAVAGPMQGFICNGPFQDVAKLAKPVVREVLAIFADPPPNIWRLIAAVSNLDLACKLTPSFPGKDEACGTLAKALAEIGGFLVDAAKYGGKIIVDGADAAESFFMGDDTPMPYDRYYATRWLPWMEYAVSRCILHPGNCQGLSGVVDNVYGRCVDYFDNHDHYEKDARKVCRGMRDNRFMPAVKATAKAMIGAAQSHSAQLRPFARLWAVEDGGTGGTDRLAQHKAFYASSCAIAERKAFPLPAGDPDACEGFKSDALLKPYYGKCLERAAAQTPSPSAAELACKRGEGRFVAIVEEEMAAFTKTLQSLAAKGCHPPAGWTGASGLKLVCDSYTGLGACLAGLKAGNEQKRCSVNVAKADAKLAKSIVADLGARRCRVEGPAVACTRPWKVDSCKAIVAGVSYPGIAKSALGCSGDLADYQAKVGVARNAIAQLNGGGRVEQPGAADSLDAQCRTPGDDKLAISCRFADRWHAKVAATPAIAFGECADDPKRDGSDGPCYRMPLMMASTSGAPVVASGAISAPPAPHNPVDNPLPPPGLARGGSALPSSSLRGEAAVAPPRSAATVPTAPARSTLDWGGSARVGATPAPASAAASPEPTQPPLRWAPPPTARAPSPAAAIPASPPARAPSPAATAPTPPARAPTPVASTPVTPPAPASTVAIASAAAASAAATERDLAAVGCKSPQGGLRFTCATRTGFDRCEAMRRQRKVEQCTLEGQQR